MGRAAPTYGPSDGHGTLGDGAEAVAMALVHRPDVVLLDIRMPGMSGIQAAQEIKARLPQTRNAIVAVVDEDQQIFEAIDAGVAGYVLKDERAESIIDAVQRAAEGQGYLSPQIAKRVLDRVATRARTQADADPPHQARDDFPSARSARQAEPRHR